MANDTEKTAPENTTIAERWQQLVARHGGNPPEEECARFRQMVEAEHGDAIRRIIDGGGDTPCKSLTEAFRRGFAAMGATR